MHFEAVESNLRVQIEEHYPSLRWRPLTWGASAAGVTVTVVCTGVSTLIARACLWTLAALRAHPGPCGGARDRLATRRQHPRRSARRSDSPLPCRQYHGRRHDPGCPRARRRHRLIAVLRRSLRRILDRGWPRSRDLHEPRGWRVDRRRAFRAGPARSKPAALQITVMSALNCDGAVGLCEASAHSPRSRCHPVPVPRCGADGSPIAITKAARRVDKRPRLSEAGVGSAVLRGLGQPEQAGGLCSNVP